MNFYLSDGAQVVGPLSSEEVLHFIKDQSIQTDKWQICDKSHVWKPLTAELTSLADRGAETRKRAKNCLERILEVGINPK